MNYNCLFFLFFFYREKCSGVSQSYNLGQKIAENSQFFIWNDNSQMFIWNALPLIF